MSMPELTAVLKQELPLFQHRDFEALLNQAGWEVGVDNDYPAEFRRRLSAASVSYHLRNKSIDYTLKRYLSDVTYDESPQNRLDKRIAWFITSRLDALNGRLIELSERSAAPSGEVISEWTFLRVPFSFRFILTCAQRGALFEALAIIRMTLEQIAWALEIRPLTGHDKIQSTSATQSIRSLRRVHSSTGRFYRWLSAHAHWAYDAHVKALDISAEAIGIRLANSLFKAQALVAALVLFDLAKNAYAHLFESLGAPGKLDFAQLPTCQADAALTAADLIKEVAALIPNDTDIQHLMQMVEPVKG
jgi:hypothetical protein